MKLLLINTCGLEGSFALADTSSNDPLQAVTMPWRSASEMLVRLLREAIAEAGWQVSEIETIGVVTGPGSFTGVRVGLSVAKGISEAIGAKLIALSRLELLASRTSCSSVCALLDAGREEFYCGVFRDGEPLGEWLLSLEEALEKAQESLEVILCEDTAEKKLAGRCLTTRVPEPTAADALCLVLKRLQKGDFADAATLDANYLRRTDAEIFSSPPRPASG